MNFKNKYVTLPLKEIVMYKGVKCYSLNKEVYIVSNTTLEFLEEGTTEYIFPKQIKKLNRRKTKFLKVEKDSSLKQYNMKNYETDKTLDKIYLVFNEDVRNLKEIYSEDFNINKENILLIMCEGMQITIQGKIILIQQEIINVSGV